MSESSGNAIVPPFETTAGGQIKTPRAAIALYGTPLSVFEMNLSYHNNSSPHQYTLHL